MDTKCPVKISLQLRPVGQPWVRVGINGQTQEQQLNALTTFEWDIEAVDQATLTVEHFGKNSTDPSTAVEIVSIGFYGISDPKFAWQGVYCPDYPEPWYSEQSTMPANILHQQTYLGWNGVYSLNFTVPVFTWIHQVQNLGWIYY